MRVAPFPKTKTPNPTKSSNDRPFIHSYLEVIRDRDNARAAGEWIFDNYSRMNPDMFTIPGWDELGPLEFLILRVCSPAGVFTTMGEGAFRAKVLEKDNQQLYQLADIAFGLSDFDFLMRLPEELTQYQPLLKSLMRKAYDHGIRAEDPRVFG